MFLPIISKIDQLKICQVWNTIVFEESKICKEYQVDVKADLNMVQKP
jgi:hypothetical protein